MKTTFDLENDLAAKLNSATKITGLTLEEVAKQALRLGVETLIRAKPVEARPYEQRSFDLGVRPGIDLDKALSLAAALEDEETLRKIQPGK